MRKQARIRSGLKQHEVAAMFDPPISRVAVGLWEKSPEQDGTAPDQKKLALLCNLYRLTAGQLLGHEPVDFVRGAESGAGIKPIIDDDKYYYIPCYTQTCGMGSGRPLQHEEITGKHSYSQSWLLAENLDPAQLCRIKGDGDSMLPTIAHKDSILVNKAENQVINGKVFAFRVGDDIRVKRLYRQMDGRVRVVSDNPDKAQYPDEFLAADDMPEIIGRVRDRSGTNNL